VTGSPWGELTDVPGCAVGHAERVGDGWLSGVTVVLPPPGTIGAVDVRGGGPATHETDALRPTTLVPTVDAVCLTGGSAYGLAAAGGVQRWCEQHGRGFGVGPPDRPRQLLVPIVPAAAIFDLGRGGDPTARPDAELGRLAAAAASPGPVRRGNVGAGTGALAAAGTLKGGVGTACVPFGTGGVLVGALAVVNPAGSPLDEQDGALLGRAFIPTGTVRPGTPTGPEAAALGRRLRRPDRAAPRPGTNTTLVVVVTDAALDPAAAWSLAAAAQDGIARAVRPAHTQVDGDTVFALATGAVRVDPVELTGLQAAAADATLLAVLDAVLTARGTEIAGTPVPGYLDLCPSLEDPWAARR